MSFIVTFYSYKGGVGRSMALANVAYELARKGKRVLMVDWDLEAPGLERYFDSNKLFKREVAGKGLLQLLMTLSEIPNEKYHAYMGSITARGIAPIGLIASGRENDANGFTTLLEKFNWKDFFSINNGGLHLENLRNQWLNDFDFVLIDSRTGLSDSSGICTIMMPDILVPMFTANYQSLFGVRDIVNFVQRARQNLKFDRMSLAILPVPSRFGARVEFKQSQEWLDRIAELLGESMNDWLPQWIEPRYVFEQIKIPQVDYFGFGERLAVVEQGTSDPEGMGFIYSKIANLLVSGFQNIESLVGKEYYEARKEQFEQSQQATNEASPKGYDAFLSYSRENYGWSLEVFLPALKEYLTELIGREPRIFIDSNELTAGEEWVSKVDEALYQSKVLIQLIGRGELDARDQKAISIFSNREGEFGTTLVFPVVLEGTSNLPVQLKEMRWFDFTRFYTAENRSSTKLISEFGTELEKLSSVIHTALLAKPVKYKQGAEQNHSLLLNLAADYEAMRESMPFGNKRTSAMAKIVSRMRELVPLKPQFLRSLAKSQKAGERLIAIVHLQAKPDMDYIEWLADRVGESESNFVGYHASIALFSAAKYFSVSERRRLEIVINQARKYAQNATYKDPNQLENLNGALTELRLKTVMKSPPKKPSGKSKPNLKK